MIIYYVSIVVKTSTVLRRRLGLHWDRRRRHRAGGGEPDIHRWPSLMPALRSTLTAFKAIIEGTMPALPRQRFGVVDVRDAPTRTSPRWPLLPPPGSVTCC
ncbi:MAG TPA: hypothetical protein VN886_21450 [Acidimicrobiales bacterium]|nr:hypothetical protein [Acidimicrobiales bacterium]